MLIGRRALVTRDVHVDEARSLVATGGSLYTRTKLVDDYARFVTMGTPSAADVKASISAHAGDDTGLTEILALLPK